MLSTLLIVLALIGSGERTSVADPTGYYLLVDNHDGAFSDIRWLELWQTADGAAKEEEGRTCFLRLGTKENGDYHRLACASLQLKDMTLEFTTEEREGVAYRFSGTFLVGGRLAETAKDGETVIRGRLTKLVQRRAVAERAAGFTFTVGD